jgi:oligopeptide/dipeptide ABC transporter ATP-binding protein
MIEAEGIVRTYRTRSALGGERTVHALRGVDFTLADAGAVSFIGESGCGKTTLGKVLTGLETPDAGRLVIGGTDVLALAPGKRREHFRRVQMVHQDPYSALNPTHTVDQILGAPLRLKYGRNRAAAVERAAQLLDLVGLDPYVALPKYPHQLSGGQRQRVVIARALTVDPEVLVADEAVSMIDVSLRLGILRLLRDLRRDLGVSLLFITHDVATARYVGEGAEMRVLYRGVVIESGPTDTVIQRPVHPYTQCLLSAIPVMRGIEQEGAQRQVPLAALDERDEPPGCLFAPRCPFAQPECSAAQPPLVTEEAGHRHACLFPEARDVVATALAASR